MRVLLIADDAATIAAVETALQDDGFVLEAASQGEDALQQAKIYDYDAVIVDLAPTGGGRDVIGRLRGCRIDAPILAVSDGGDIDAIVNALGLGADDCVAKPFNCREFVARLRAIIRRAKGYAEPTIHVGKLAIDLGGRVAKVGSHPLNLTKKEYGVLELLGLRKGRPLEKEYFLDHLYDGRDEPEPKIVDVFICKLRKKLAEATGGEHYIETIWGRGYMMRDPDPAVLHYA